jgi:hypothetical protein
MNVRVPKTKSKQERKGREGKEQGRKGFHVEKRVRAARVAIIRL